LTSNNSPAYSLTATAEDMPKLVASHDGTYSGQLCNLFTIVGEKAPRCWPLDIVVRNGIIEGNWISWISKSMKPAKAYGTVGDDGSVKLNLASWTSKGFPAMPVK